MVSPVFITLTAFKGELANAGGVGSRTAAELDDTRLDYHLGQASDQVVAALYRYTLPAGPADTPPLLAGIVVGIAAYTATLEYFGSQPLEPLDPVNLRYQRAMGMLKDLRDGKLVIDGVNATAPGEAIGEPEVYDAVSYLGIAEGWWNDEQQIAGPYPAGGHIAPGGGW